MNGRIIIVTGAAGSIGQAICQRFLDQGDIVIALDIDMDSLNSLFIELYYRENQLHIFQVDVTDEASVKKIIEIAYKEIGFVEVLINNAGGNFTTLLSKTDKQAWDNDIALNLNSSFYTCQGVLKHMKKAQQGCIVNVCSVNALSIYGDPGYSVAKAGLVHFTRFIAVEYGGYGIRANAICPGTIKTKIWSDRLKKDPNLYQNLSSLCPLQKIGKPKDIANLARFLCSYEANMITGSHLVIDGGLTAGIPSIMEKFALFSDSVGSVS